jgi:hypothetical protein
VSGVTYVVRSGGGRGVHGGTAVDEHGTPIGTLTLDWDGYYFVVPLMVKQGLAAGLFRPYPAAGTEMGIPVKGEQVSDTSPVGGGASTGGVKDVRDDMRVLEFSLAAAAGLEFPVGSNAGFVEVAYSHGLNDVWKDDLEEVRFRTLTLSAGVMF